MSQTAENRRSGSCLCGAVKVSAMLSELSIQACHCEQCRRWTGGSPLFVCPVTEANISTAQEPVVYRHSAWGERVFCAQCGSPLYWKMQDGDITHIAVGLLDDQSGLRVTDEIFVDYRPEWQPPWPGASQSTEAEEFAKLNASLKESAK